MRQTSGTLRYRKGRMEVLLIHDVDRTCCGIPEGGVRRGEELEAAARRETWEETAILAPTELTYLGSVVRGTTEVHCFTGEVADDAEPQPDNCEVDGAAFVPVPIANWLLPPSQKEFVTKLIAMKELKL